MLFDCAPAAWDFMIFKRFSSQCRHSQLIISLIFGFIRHNFGRKIYKNSTQLSLNCVIKPRSWLRRCCCEHARDGYFYPWFRAFVSAAEKKINVLLTYRGIFQLKENVLDCLLEAAVFDCWVACVRRCSLFVTKYILLFSVLAHFLSIAGECSRKNSLLARLRALPHKKLLNSF